MQCFNKFAKLYFKFEKRFRWKKVCIQGYFPSTQAEKIYFPFIWLNSNIQPKKKNFWNLQKYLSYLGKCIFKYKLINQEGVIISYLGEFPGGIFVTTTHVGAHFSVYFHILFTSHILQSPQIIILKALCQFIVLLLSSFCIFFFHFQTSMPMNLFLKDTCKCGK